MSTLKDSLPLLARVLRQPRTIVWAALLVALAAALAFVRGFDALSYYFCLIVALAGSFAAGHIGVGAVRVARSVEPAPSVLRVAGVAVVASILLSVLPLALITLNALRVKTCDYPAGLLFYLIGPVTSMALSAAFGVSAGALTRTSPRGTALLVAGMVASFVWLAAHFYSSPQIFAYSPFFGFLSGAIYDDVITITRTLVLYRLGNVLQAALALAVAASASVHLRPHVGALRHAGPRRLSLIAALAVSVTALFLLRGHIGYEVSSEDIQRELGGRYETEHLVLYYPADSPKIVKEIQWLAEDHEFRYHELEELFGAPSKARIESYIYRSRAQKRRLMGADKVYVAKPWLHQIHLSGMPYGASVVKHEMAHVFAGDYAPGPLHVTARAWVLPHMALIEGLATAIEWDRGRLTPHQWSAAMQELGFLPELTRIMGPEGYLSTFGGTAYTAAGSFCRYLIDRYGMPRMLTVYGDGDFTAAYGRPIESLLTEWKGFLSDRTQVPLSPDDLARARFYFDRKGVLQRVCPLVVAGLERAAADMVAKGRLDVAIPILRQVLAYTPKNVEKQAQLMTALFQAGEDDEARELARGILASENGGAFLKASVRGRVADADYRAGRLDEARATYEELQKAPLDQGSLRAIEVKLRALDDPNPVVRDGVRDYLLRPHKKDESLALIRDLNYQAPASALLAYLLGRRLVTDGSFAEALQPLLWSDLLARTDPRGVPLVAIERDRVTGLCYYFLGAPLEAERALARSQQMLPELALGLRNEVQDWINRCRWRAARKDAAVAATGGVELPRGDFARELPSAVASADPEDRCGCGRRP